METQKIAVENIHLDPDQPREVYTGIAELSASILSKGFLEDQAISVWKHPELELPEGFEVQVADGHRRTMAAKKVSDKEIIPCFVHDLSDMSFTEARHYIWELQLVSNANREDLTIMNRARSFQRSMDEHDMTEGRVAQIHGLSVTTVRADLELCSLAQELHPLVDNGTLAKEVARKLATSFDGDGKQMHVFNNHVKSVTTAKKQLAAIEAYINANAQNKFSLGKKIAAETGGLQKARKASERLEGAVNAYEKYIGDVNVLNARKRDVRQLEQMAHQMKKIYEKLLENIREWDAMKTLNKKKSEQPDPVQEGEEVAEAA